MRASLAVQWVLSDSDKKESCSPKAKREKIVLKASRCLVATVIMFCTYIHQVETVDASEATLQTEINRTLLFCGDKAGWPPYTFEKDGLVQGYDLDVLKQALAPYNLHFKVYMLPWKRCLEMVKQGQMDVALSASGNEERVQTYRMTAPYYQMTPSYIYLNARFPDGIHTPPEKLAQSYKVCGLRGYSYHSFGLSTEDVESTSQNFKQLFSKTRAGRCDLLLGRYEVLIGFALTGNILLTDLWKTTPVPGVDPDDFRMLVSRAVPQSVELHRILNTRIMAMKTSGELDRLLKPYLSATIPVE